MHYGKHIVGTKIATYMTARREANVFRVTLHRWAWQLHATKGWRVAGHSDKDMVVSKFPTPAEFAANATVEYHHGRKKQRYMDKITVRP